MTRSYVLSVCLIAILFLLNVACAQQSKPAQEPIRALCKDRQVLNLDSASNYPASVSAGKANIAVGHSEVVTIYERVSNKWAKLQELQPPTDVTEDFGKTVLLEENWLAVGQPAWAEGSYKPGIVWMYRRTLNSTNNKYYFKLHSNVTVPGTRDANEAQFGFSISMLNNTLIVGAPKCCGTSRTGGAFVFYYSGSGNQTGWLPFANTENGIAEGSIKVNENYGWNVAIDEDFALVSTPYSVETGTIYFYSLKNNALSIGNVVIPTMSALVPAPAPGDLCGQSMSRAVHGRIAYGCPSYNNRTGIVYVANQGYSKQGTIYYADTVVESPYPSEEQQFGILVATTDFSLIVGTSNETFYIYEYISNMKEGSRWVHTQTITSSVTNSTGTYGVNVDWVNTFQLEAASGYVETYFCPAPKSSASSLVAGVTLMLAACLAALLF